MNGCKKVLAILAAGAAMLSSTALAADTQGRFAAKSFGNESCRVFSAAWDMSKGGNADLRNQHIAWVAGYVTALNQLDQDTFDISSWRSMPYLTASLAAFCGGNPTKPVMQALGAMVKRLSRGKLAKADTSVSFGSSASQVRLYNATYNDMLSALIDGGYLSKTIAKDDAETISQALGAFQRDKQISVTGLPDETTLFHLLSRS